MGRPHRWGYATELRRDADDDNGFGGRLVRIDGKTGDVEAHRPRRRPRAAASG